MEIDTKIKKIIKDIIERKIDLCDTREVVEKCYTLFKKECKSRKYLEKYVEQIEGLHRKSRFRSNDPKEIRLIQANLRDILENSSLKNGHYRNENEGKIVEAMRFENDIEKVKFFCLPYSVTIKNIYPQYTHNLNAYVINLLKPNEYRYSFLTLECFNMLVKYKYSLVNKKGKVVEEDLLLWSMSVYAFNRIYSPVEEGEVI